MVLHLPGDRTPLWRTSAAKSEKLEAIFCLLAGRLEPPWLGSGMSSASKPAWGLEEGVEDKLAFQWHLLDSKAALPTQEKPKGPRW
jgi:hypothetical protein